MIVRFATLAAAFTALVATAAPAATPARQPIEGVWKRTTLVIRIAPCGAKLCGTVIGATPSQQAKAKRGSNTDLIGSQLIKNITPAGPGRYRGSVFVADRNMHASGTINQPNPNLLEVRGCVVGIICKTSRFTRVR